MSRPQFPPGVVLPVSCIRDIRERPRLYDENPEAYEEREEQKKQQRLEEEYCLDQLKKQEDEKEEK